MVLINEVKDKFTFSFIIFSTNILLESTILYFLFLAYKNMNLYYI
jgi:hypothetical protein